MNCPDCQAEMRVSRTAHGGTPKKPITVREHSCGCGQRFASEDRITRRLAAISSNRHPYTVAKPTVNDGQTDGLGDSLVPKGGLGVSDLGLSGLNPDPSGHLSDLRLDLFQGVDPARVKRDQNYSADFLSFWLAYPRKEAKGAAWRAWKKLRPPVELILAALAWQRSSAAWTKDGGEYVPLPASYLNATRWEDERPGAASSHVYANGYQIPALPPGTLRPR